MKENFVGLVPRGPLFGSGQTNAISPADPNKVAHSSGAASSHFSPFSFNATYEGAKVTAQRFAAGNAKYENNTNVYADANWLKAYHAKDWKFFRDRAGHALEHLIDEMRGKNDSDPGGNLGALGWFVDVMAFVKVNDPVFYQQIQGTISARPKVPELAEVEFPPTDGKTEASISAQYVPKPVQLTEADGILDGINGRDKRRDGYLYATGYKRGCEILQTVQRVFGYKPFFEPR